MTDPRRAGAPRDGKRRMLRRSKEAVTGWIFVAPAVVLFGVFGVYTVGYGFLLSFARWNGISPKWDWVGLGNFRDLLANGDPLLTAQSRAAAGRTLAVMIVLPVAVLLISFPLAVLLNSITRFRAFLRTVYFLPYVTSGIAVFYAWRFMYEPNGMVNSLLRGFGLGALAQDQGFLGNPSSAFVATLAVLVWINVPLGVLLFLTGLQTIPEEIIDAARTDGASRFRILRSVVLPLLNPITAIIVILQLREALQNYQLFLLLTNGGPIDKTTTLGLKTYLFAFGRNNNNLGYASALGWVLAAVAIVLAAVNFRALRSRTA